MVWRYSYIISSKHMHSEARILSYMISCIHMYSEARILSYQISYRQVDHEAESQLPDIMHTHRL